MAIDSDLLAILRQAFAGGLGPDPLPDPPEHLTPAQLDAWLLGVRASAAWGVQLHLQESQPHA